MCRSAGPLNDLKTNKRILNSFQATSADFKMELFVYNKQSTCRVQTCRCAGEIRCVQKSTQAREVKMED